MGSIITEKQIKKFAAKHHADYLGLKDGEIWVFQGHTQKLFLSQEDISIDLEKDVPVGLIELYMAEATEGHVKDFETWLTDHKYF